MRQAILEESKLELMLLGVLILQELEVGCCELLVDARPLLIADRGQVERSLESVDRLLEVGQSLVALKLLTLPENHFQTIFAVKHELDEQR